MRYKKRLDADNLDGVSLRKREMAGEMMTIDCEGVKSARESYYAIARLIRSLPVAGLKLHDKADSGIQAVHCW